MNISNISFNVKSGDDLPQIFLLSEFINSSKKTIYCASASARISRHTSPGYRCIYRKYQRWISSSSTRRRPCCTEINQRTLVDTFCRYYAGGFTRTLMFYCLRTVLNKKFSFNYIYHAAGHLG